MSDIKASFERAIELNEGSLAGGRWRAYASFLEQVPGSLGGDRPRTSWPCLMGIGIASVGGSSRPLSKGPIPEAIAESPLYNTMALPRANELLAEQPCTTL